MVRLGARGEEPEEKWTTPRAPLLEVPKGHPEYGYQRPLDERRVQSRPVGKTVLR